MSGGPATAPRTSTNPFPGPVAYTAAESAVFYGRKPQVNQLTSLVVSSAIVLVHAPSGQGKSSLIDAGLLPKLQARGVHLMPAVRLGQTEAPGEPRPGTTAVNPFIRLVVDAAGGPKAGEKNDLQSVLTRLLAATPEQLTLLVLDQFEEIFINPARWQERAEFLRELRRALDSLPRFRVLCALRSDYLADLVALDEDFPSRMFVRFALESLDEPTARRVIQEAFADTGVRITDNDLDEVMDGLLAIEMPDAKPVRGSHVNLVQLQIFCRRLWERHRQAPETGPPTERIEDLATSMRLFVDAAVSDVVSSHFQDEGVLRQWLTSNLVTGRGQRRIVELEEDGAAGLPKATVEALERARLVQIEQRNRGRWVELTHDSMVDALHKSNKEWESEHRRRRLKRLLVAAAVLALLGLAYIPLRSAPLTDNYFYESAFVERSGSTTIGLGRPDSQGVLAAAVTIDPVEPVDPVDPVDPGGSLAEVRLVETPDEDEDAKKTLREVNVTSGENLVVGPTRSDASYALEVQVGASAVSFEVEGNVVERLVATRDEAGRTQVVQSQSEAALRVKPDGYVMLRGLPAGTEVVAGGELLNQDGDASLVRAGPAGYLVLRSIAPLPTSFEVDEVTDVLAMPPDESLTFDVVGTTVLEIADVEDSDPLTLDVECGDEAVKIGLVRARGFDGRAPAAEFPTELGGVDEIHSLLVGRANSGNVLVWLDPTAPDEEVGCDISLRRPLAQARQELGEFQVELGDLHRAVGVSIELDRAAILVTNRTARGVSTRLQCARGAVVESPRGKRLLAYVPAGARCVLVAALDDFANPTELVLDAALVRAPERLTERAVQ